MTASELQSLEAHSDATVCSGLYAKSTGPKWSTKMHASKLLKGVLISRTLNSSPSSDQESSSAGGNINVPTRGKRAFSSDSSSALTSATLVPKKSTSSSCTLPIKTTCLCAPTKHAGSFRCRLHRVTQKHWDGRQVHHAASTASSSSSLSPANENSGSRDALQALVAPGWASTGPAAASPGTGCLSRTGAAATVRPSRLRMVVVAAQHAEEMDSPDVDDDPASPMLSDMISWNDAQDRGEKTCKGDAHPNQKEALENIDDCMNSRMFCRASSVKYIKVATSTTIAQEVIVNETGAASVSQGKMQTSSS